MFMRLTLSQPMNHLGVEEQPLALPGSVTKLLEDND